MAALAGLAPAEIVARTGVSLREVERILAAGGALPERAPLENAGALDRMRERLADVPAPLADLDHVPATAESALERVRFLHERYRPSAARGSRRGSRHAERGGDVYAVAERVAIVAHNRTEGLRSASEQALLRAVAAPRYEVVQLARFWKGTPFTLVELRGEGAARDEREVYRDATSISMARLDSGAPQSSSEAGVVTP